MSSTPWVSPAATSTPRLVSDAAGSKAAHEGPLYDCITDFCAAEGGHQPILRLLIANNGNAAMKAIKSLRAWCLRTFSNEKELQIVGMATLEDEQANAEYISRCDYLARVPGGSNNYNYANVHLIKEVAEQWDCDAVWPGWGHASEDHRVPKILQQTSKPVLWVGPGAAAMEALGCKIGSTILAQSVGVPTVPWSGWNVHVQPSDDGLYRVSQDLKESACIFSAERLIDLINEGHLEFPLMIKAAAGGGGKGIRICRDVNDVHTAYRHVQSEVMGSLIFAMKLVSHCRHLEVQILADQCGEVISLGCRDCTIQRRHQKIIEEGPPTVCTKETLAAMERAAIDICKAVGYSNAATVEFLYDIHEAQFYFLEVNARLQVEHVVTEMLTDVNLPAAQLQLAMGIRLINIWDVALYLDRKRKGILEKRHCVTARVTAEDAENGFKPTCGEVHELAFESAPHVWAYFSIGSTSRVHQYADSQFGHIFATCPDRETARNVLILSLRSLIVRGEICTNVEALQKILESPDFIRNETYTTWLEQRVRFTSPPPARQVVGSGTLSAVIFAGVYKASRHFAGEQEAFISRLNQGQVPKPLPSSYSCELVYRDTTKFYLECFLLGPDEIRVAMNGSVVDCRFNAIMAAGSESEKENTSRQRGDTGWYFISGGLDGKHRRVCFREDPRQDSLRVTINSSMYYFTKERDPTEIRAPFSGKLVRWIAPALSTVQQGSPYAEIEIMKMYVQLTCDAPGRISHVLSEGAVFAVGDLLATLELPEGQKVIRPVLYEGHFPPPISGRKQSELTGVLVKEGDFCREAPIATK